MSSQTRRDFLKHTTAAAATIAAGCATNPPAARLARRGPLIVSTWGFGKPANERALKVLQGGGSALDAVEQGVRLVESSGNSSVGLSGKPNAAGVVQLDACIRSEEHTSELQSRTNLVCRLLLEKKKTPKIPT